MGRPSGTFEWKPSERDIKQIESLSGHGLLISHIASIFGVSKATFERRQIDTPEINEAIKRGKALALSSVSQVAYKMASSGKSAPMTQFWLKVRGGWSEELAQRESVFEKPATEDSLIAEESETDKSL